MRAVYLVNATGDIQLCGRPLALPRHRSRVEVQAKILRDIGCDSLAGVALIVEYAHQEIAQWGMLALQHGGAREDVVVVGASTFRWQFSIDRCAFGKVHNFIARMLAKILRGPFMRTPAKLLGKNPLSMSSIQSCWGYNERLTPSLKFLKLT